MYIDKKYLDELRTLINNTPWRCNDEHLVFLLDIMESLVIEHEELVKTHLVLSTNSIQHADMLRGQLITCLLNKGDIVIKSNNTSTIKSEEVLADIKIREVLADIKISYKDYLIVDIVYDSDTLLYHGVAKKDKDLFSLEAVTLDLLVQDLIESIEFMNES